MAADDLALNRARAAALIILCMHLANERRRYIVHRLSLIGRIDHFVYAPSHWETMLHCNIVSHWLGTFIIFCMHPANDIRYCIVTSSLTGWAHSQHNPCNSQVINLVFPVYSGFSTRRVCLTHWGRVTHICSSKLTIIGSDNGLLPDRRQAII